MRVLMVVNTIFELYYLSSVGYLLKRVRPEVRLQLLTKPKIATRLNPELLHLYTDIQTVNFPGISGKPVSDIANSLRFWYKLRQLDLDANVMCINSFREYFANVLCRHLKGHVRLVALRMADHNCDHLCQVKKPLHSLYANLFNRAFGISTMEYRWHQDTAHTSAHWFRQDPYDRTICISDWGHEQGENEFRLSPPFVALRHYYGLGQGDIPTHELAIVLIGERTPLYEGWNSKEQTLYEYVFDFLRQKFSGYRLLFRPRAGLTDLERLKPFLEGFELMPADIPFEELCIRNSYSKVISIKSTACKVAAYYGIPAYVLYPMFELPSSLRQILDAYLADMQSIVRVHDLSELMNNPPVIPKYDIQELSELYWQAVMEGMT